MHLNEYELAIIKQEARAMAKELRTLPPERGESRCRLLAILLANVGFAAGAEVARQRALCFSAGTASQDDLEETLEHWQ